MTISEKIIVEKTLTYIYSKLCADCREKFREAIVEMGLDIAEDLAGVLNLPF